MPGVRALHVRVPGSWLGRRGTVPDRAGEPGDLQGAFAALDRFEQGYGVGLQDAKAGSPQECSAGAFDATGLWCAGYDLAWTGLVEAAAAGEMDWDLDGEGFGGALGIAMRGQVDFDSTDPNWRARLDEHGGRTHQVFLNAFLAAADES